MDYKERKQEENVGGSEIGVPKQKYTLIEKKEKEKKFIIEIEADSNDADYISEREEYTESSFRGVIRDIQYLRAKYAGSHEFGDFSSENLPIPYSSNGRCHTLSRLSIWCLDTDGRLYDVVVEDADESDEFPEFDEDYEEEEDDEEEE